MFLNLNVFNYNSGCNHLMQWFAKFNIYVDLQNKIISLLFIPWNYLSSIILRKMSNNSLFHLNFYDD